MGTHAEPHRDDRREPRRAAWLLGAAIVGAMLCSSPAAARTKGRLGEALKQCILASVRHTGSGLFWGDMGEKDAAFAFLLCDGEEARALYDALGGVVAEQGPREEDGRRFLIREFGASSTSLTRCVHAVPDATGNDPSAFSCRIAVDASPALLDGTLH